MDVRMLLPASNPVSDETIGGRPFVCEVIDGLRMPSKEALDLAMHEINHTAPDSESSDERKRRYGQNPMGVGVSSFELASSKAFKNLQAETENKVKYYQCLCWSQSPLPRASDELKRLLGTYPLELKQRTPIRVLHRRSNAVRTRHILTCEFERIKEPTTHRLDDHYCRLLISTDAGTYVKEFVHSDLGRTTPSLSSLLGCKTDILELDCVGIQC